MHTVDKEQVTTRTTYYSFNATHAYIIHSSDYSLHTPRSYNHGVQTNGFASPLRKVYTSMHLDHSVPIG